MEFIIEGSRPIWQQLTEQLARRILSGTYPLGSRFPAVRELAAEAGVNPNTMQRAITQLETLGLVQTNRTLGRTVTEDAAVLEEMRRRLAVQCTENFFREMRELGYPRGEAADIVQTERNKNDE